MMNSKLSQQRSWNCHESGQFKTIQIQSHNQYASFKLASFLYWLKTYAQVYLIHSRKLINSLSGSVEIVLMSLFLCQDQNLYRLRLAFVRDRRIVEIISLIFKSSSTIHHSSPIMQFHSACYCCCNVQFMLQANIFYSKLSQVPLKNPH